MSFVMSFVQAIVNVICTGDLTDLQAIKDLLKEIDWFCEVGHVQAERNKSQDRRRQKARDIYKGILLGEHGEIAIDLTAEDGPICTMQITGSRNSTYEVTATQGGVTCTCPDSWEFGRLCKHKMAFAAVIRKHLPQVATHLAARFVEPVRKAKAKSNAA